MVAANSEQLAKMEVILEQLDRSPLKNRDDNRRHALRVNVRLSLTVTVLGAVAPCPVQIYTRNFSVSGIAFVSRRMFKIHERLAIHLQVKGLPARLVLARITFSRYVSAGLYEMGAEFLECLKDRAHLAIPAHWLAASPVAYEKPVEASDTPAKPATPQSAPPEKAANKAPEKPVATPH